MHFAQSSRDEVETPSERCSATSGVAPTGDIGPDTIKALQRHVSVSQSGVWGKETTRGMQRRLNANTF